jgi:hypothetical protein
MPSLFEPQVAQEILQESINCNLPLNKNGAK